jgi:hypothetical protein
MMAANLLGTHKCRTGMLYSGLLTYHRAPYLLERGEARVKVDLDADKPAEKKKPPYFCIIKQTTEIKMAGLDAYLSGKMAWDNSVLECLSK